jgi:C4-dicarboxylate-binding protein DctP
MKHMKKISVALTACHGLFATSALAKCEKGEVVAKLSHVTGGSTHPKVVASNRWQNVSTRK